MLPRLALAGLIAQIGALLCFGVVFAQLYGIEHPIQEGVGGTVINWTEARLVRRWALAGIVLLVAGAVMLVVALTRRPAARAG